MIMNTLANKLAPKWLRTPEIFQYIIFKVSGVKGCFTLSSLVRKLIWYISPLGAESAALTRPYVLKQTHSHGSDIAWLKLGHG